MTTNNSLNTGAVPLPFSQGGVGAALTAANGGILYSNATTAAILAPTATANQPLLSGALGAPGWSTATYPGSTTINQLLYSSAANTIVGLATGNSGVLVTSAGGVPSISSTLPAALTIPQPSITGVTNASSASAGAVGEVISSIISSGSAVTLTNNTASNVTSITLTAGDWDVWGNVTIVTVATAPSQFLGWTSTTSATQPDISLLAGPKFNTGIIALATGVVVPYQRYNVSGSTTVYLTASYAGDTGNGTGCGQIFARRVR
jgi:hypothetical protein